MERLINEAKDRDIPFNVDYPKNSQGYDIQESIRLTSRDLMFSYARIFYISQEEFEESFDVLKKSIDLLKGSRLGSDQEDRTKEIVGFALNQKEHVLKIPYRCFEYQPGNIPSELLDNQKTI